MATTATQVVLDTPAAEFQLPATDGKTYALDDVAGEKGTVVVFICNHCPYVKAVIDRMVSDARVLMSESIGFAAICSNDAASYHYFGRFIHAVAFRRFVFCSRDIAEVAVER